MQWQKQTSRLGFTIVELLIVIVVIAILAVIIVVVYNGITQRAKVAAQDSHLSELIKNSEMHNVTNGAYPAHIGEVNGSTDKDTYVFAGNRYCVATTDASGASRYKYSDNSSSGAGTCYGIAPTYATAPESCFGFNSSTQSITAYYQHQSNNSADPKCPAEFTIPNTIGGVSVLTTDGNAFQDTTHIKAIRFASGMTSIGNGAFSSPSVTSGLSYVYFPSSITTIGGGAFYATRLSSVTIPATVSSVGSGSFGGNPSLKSVSIGMDSTSSSPSVQLNSGQFSDAPALKRVEIGAHVTHLGSGAFGGGAAISDFVFQPGGDRDLTIGPISLGTSTSLVSLNLPARTVSINSSAFAYLPTLKKLTIAEGNKPLVIDTGALTGSGIESITLPGRTSLLTNGCCSGLSGLKQLTINEGTTDLTITNGAFGGAGLVSVDFPSQLREITNGAFSGSSLLTTVTFKTGVVSLTSSAFSSTGITAVSVPTATTVDGTAFPAGTTITRF